MLLKINIHAKGPWQRWGVTMWKFSNYLKRLNLLDAGIRYLLGTVGVGIVSFLSLYLFNLLTGGWLVSALGGVTHADHKKFVDSLQSAVIAFDRKNDGGEQCPPGWALFLPAGGRVLVGAGPHQNGVSDYPSYSEDQQRAVGGVDKNMLNIQQIPEHTHRAQNNRNFLALGQATSNYSTGASDEKKYAGEAWPTTAGIERTSATQQDVENRQPFVAIYFCKQRPSASK